MRRALVVLALLGAPGCSHTGALETIQTYGCAAWERADRVVDQICEAPRMEDRVRHAGGDD